MEAEYRQKEEKRKLDDEKTVLVGWCPVAARQRREEKHKHKMMNMNEEEKQEIGLVMEGEWQPLEGLRTKLIYNTLMNKRLKLKKYKPRKTHENIQTIQKELTANERDYWWRLSHRLIMTNERVSKYNKDVQSDCPVCGEQKEDWAHYDYACEKEQEMVGKVAMKMNRKELSREQWGLDTTDLKEEEMVVVAKARWIYHKERCKMDMGMKKRMNVTVLMNRLERAMETSEESKRRKLEKKQEKEQKKKQEKKQEKI